MTGIAFPDANTALTRPEGVETEACYDLPVYKGKLPDGQAVVVSCWEPTIAELDEIIKTGKVWLMVWGTTHAPLVVTGHYPFKEPTSAVDGQTG